MLYNQPMTIDSGKLAGFIEEQGWSGYGVVSIQEVSQALEKHEGVFEDWLKKGYAAEMNYLKVMQKDRFHPENKLPDVKSVIVLQAWYGMPDRESDEGFDRGRRGVVARYARGRDYHHTLKAKLRLLSAWLTDQVPGLRFYASVDSGPTVDRVLAEAAGLGFSGKNTNLIDPSKGSYFFIASLLVNVALPFTKKRRMPNCGDCQKCAQACPTGALVAPHTLDARRCIAYLTIENKEGVPPEFRSAIGGRLFGCDSCQEVCPFNQERGGKQALLMSDFSAENGAGGRLELRRVLELESDDQFRLRFAGTPLLRAGRVGLIRNACIVAGNLGDESFISLLKDVLRREDDKMLQEQAKWAIAEIEKRAR